jgi:N-acetylglucosaminyldiphosphoundecaprenol N-acetyl-beta-D-mannosaminyltransferase
MTTALSTVEAWIEKGERQYVCVTGVHGVMESQRDPALMRIHNDSGLTVPDGTPMVWSGRFAGARGIERVYGPDFMLAACRRAAKRGWTSFFYGAAPGIADAAGRRLQARIPGLLVGGTISPPYGDVTEEEDAEFVERIN